MWFLNECNKRHWKINCSDSYLTCVLRVWRNRTAIKPVENPFNRFSVKMIFPHSSSIGTLSWSGSRWTVNVSNLVKFNFIWVFAYSSLLKYFTEVGSGTLIFKFHAASALIHHLTLTTEGLSTSSDPIRVAWSFLTFLYFFFKWLHICI